jgi:hypothetical protein
MAWLLLYKTKSEIIAIIEALPDETYFDMVDGIRDAADFFKLYFEMVNAAEMRLLAASAAQLTKREPRK